MDSPANARIAAPTVAPGSRFGLDYKIGVVPLLVFIILALIVYLASITGTLPKDMVGGFATVLVLGMLLGHFGLNIPILKDIGGPAILSIFLPSIMVYYHLLNADLVKSITALMKDSNFLYFYICALVSGSILGMNRTVLIQGFLRMFVPLIAGTIAAVCVGLLVGFVCRVPAPRSPAERGAGSCPHWCAASLRRRRCGVAPCSRSGARGSASANRPLSGSDRA